MQSVRTDNSSQHRLAGGRVIVCHCNALRESQVREAARAGSLLPRCAYARLGCRPRCGQCLPFAAEVIRDESARLAA